MKLKKVWKLLFFAIAIILSIFIINRGIYFTKELITTKKLENLNYEEKAIEVIKNKELETYIIDNALYSKTLNNAFKNNNFILNNIDGYIEAEYKEHIDNAKAINILFEKKYSITEIINIFQYLDGDEITKLLDLNYEELLTSLITYDYFNIDNLNRYTIYNDIKNYDIETVITYVNIGIDNDFYTNIKISSDPSNLLVLCNKYNALPEDYVPDNLEKISSKYSSGTKELRSDAKKAFEEMATVLENMGMHIEARSAYRSYEYQEDLYNSYVSRDGRKKADTYSARPGHSEHQTGLAVDVHDGSWGTFSYTKEYEWVKENAHTYGFIIRYTKDNEFITGYMSEPWHLRYVGVETATYIYENDLTFDEYYIKFIEKK